jgi:hypothetical protein
MQPDPRGSVSSSLGLKCPSPLCDSTSAAMLVRSATIVTFRCGRCGFQWSADITGLPEAIRFQIDDLTRSVNGM